MEEALEVPLTVLSFTGSVTDTDQVQPGTRPDSQNVTGSTGTKETETDTLAFCTVKEPFSGPWKPAGEGRVKLYVPFGAQSTRVVLALDVMTPRALTFQAVPAASPLSVNVTEKSVYGTSGT
jgi:hypothetical protein